MWLLLYNPQARELFFFNLQPKAVADSEPCFWLLSERVFNTLQ